MDDRDTTAVLEIESKCNSKQHLDRSAVAHDMEDKVAKVETEEQGGNYLGHLQGKRTDLHVALKEYADRLESEIGEGDVAAVEGAAEDVNPTGVKAPQKISFQAPQNVMIERKAEARKDKVHTLRQVRKLQGKVDLEIDDDYAPRQGRQEGRGAGVQGKGKSKSKGNKK